MAKNTNTALREQVIYSVYVRNHTPEGTFRAVIPDLDRIRALGTDIVWFMPIHPIGEKGKKGSLGCPYANRDYGTVNPCSFGLWGEYEKKWYRIREYYYDSRKIGEQRTDAEHYEELEKLADNLRIESVIVDPSAASFIQCIRRKGRFTVIPAKNDVVDGIRQVSDALKQRVIYFSPECKDTLREFSLYKWDDKAVRDAPRKENDHAMDDLRYFVTTALNAPENDFFVMSVSR